MTPEERVELMRRLIERGISVYTYYRGRRVVAVREEGQWVVLQYDDGSADRIHVNHFARRKFVAVI
jgi:hypothetical protein